MHSKFSLKWTENLEECFFFFNLHNKFIVIYLFYLLRNKIYPDISGYFLDNTDI